MAGLPTGLSPYISPVADTLHSTLALSMFGIGFVLFAWLFIYQVTTGKQERSLAREILISVCISILWGFGALFGMLSLGIYL
jgi:hypothetical protein